MPARKCPQSPKPGATGKFSRCHARSRLRAAGRDGWAPRARQGREHDARRGLRSVLVAGPPAMGVQVLCSPRRAGPPRRVFPTSASTSLQTRQLARQGARGEHGGAPGRGRSAAPPHSTRAQTISATSLAKARGMPRVCGVPRPVTRPRPPQPCTAGGAPSSSRATRGSHHSKGRPHEQWHRKPRDQGAGDRLQGRRGRLCR